MNSCVSSLDGSFEFPMYGADAEISVAPDFKTLCDVASPKMNMHWYPSLCVHKSGSFMSARDTT